MKLVIEIQAVLALVAASGVTLAVLLKPGERIKAAAFLLGWLLPGLGHAVLGRWRKGVFFLAILGATWTAGMWLSGFRSIAWEDNPFYYLGQYGSGATFLAAKCISAEKAFPRPDLHPSWFDPGLLYVCVVGLLNLVVALNVFEIPLGRPAAAPAPPPPAAPAGEEKPA